MINLTQENYYSDEANKEFFSVSLFKSFEKCEAATLASVNGEYKRSSTEALLMGNYVHSYFESEEAHEAFKQANADEMLTKAGKLKAGYRTAERMIDKLSEQKAFKNLYAPGDKEVIVTGELNGIKWRGKIDSLVLDKNYFADIKTNADLHKGIWIKDEDGRNVKVPFIEGYGYYMQMAMYTELIRQTFGKTCQPFIFAVSKQEPCDVMAIDFNSSADAEKMEEALEYILANQQHYRDIIDGKTKPKRCNKCEYCRQTASITSFVHASEIEID